MALHFLEFCSLWRSQCLLASGKAMLKISLKAAISSLTSAPEEGIVVDGVGGLGNDHRGNGYGEQRLCEADDFVDRMSRVHVDEVPIQGTCLSALVPGALPTPQELDHILPCKDKDVDKRSFQKQF